MKQKSVYIKIGVLLLMLPLMELVYRFTFYRRDLDLKSYQVLEIKNKQDSTDVFYFTESSGFYSPPNDSIDHSVSQFANRFFPDLKFTEVRQEASHAGMYRYWLPFIDTKDHKPKAIVVVMNLRSFDAAWRNSRLETPLQESVVLLKHRPRLLNRFLLSLNVFDNKSEQQREEDMLNEWKNTTLRFPFEFKYRTVREWDDGMANGGYLLPDGNWDFEKIALACHYIKAFAFNIDENNQRIKDFDDMADWCEKNGVKLYFNLMSENVHYADSLVGKELVYLMKSNRDFLVKRYNRKNCVVVDNLELIEGKWFVDQQWTSEHYFCRGRMKIAAHLAEMLEKQFPAEYRKAY